MMKIEMHKIFKELIKNEKKPFTIGYKNKKMLYAFTLL